MCQPHACNSSEDSKCISTCVDQSHSMIVSTQKVSQLVCTQPTPCYRELKMHINMYWTNLYHAREDTKLTSTSVYQTPIMLARTQQQGHLNICQGEQKMHLNLCWPKPFHACGDTKWISTSADQDPSNIREDTKSISSCVVQTHPVPVNTRNASQYMMNEPIPWQRGYLNKCWPNIPCLSGQNIHLNMCWRNPSHASEDTKCTLTYVNHTHSMPLSKQNVSQRVDQTVPC